MGILRTVTHTAHSPFCYCLLIWTAAIWSSRIAGVRVDRGIDVLLRSQNGAGFNAAIKDKTTGS